MDSNPFYCGVGGVVSGDIAVPEHERELAFYASILATGDSPLWQADLTNNQGTPIIGLGQRIPEYESLPLQWMPHIQVANVAAAVERGLALGGQELMHGKDDDGNSLWAGLTDPAGAGFGIIPVVDDDAYTVEDPKSVGRITSLSMVTSDPAGTASYYADVVGWTASERDDHAALLAPDGSVAAVLVPPRDGLADVPPIWLLGLPVDDLDASLAAVGAGGGDVVYHDTNADIAIIRDPVGIYLALQAN